MTCFFSRGGIRFSFWHLSVQARDFASAAGVFCFTRAGVGIKPRQLTTTIFLSATLLFASATPRLA